MAIVCNKEFLKKNLGHLGQKFTFHQLPILPEQSNLCGELAIYFCITRILNFDLPYEDVLHLCFTEDPWVNQQRVKNFFMETWNKVV